jgi:ribokinase
MASGRRVWVTGFATLDYVAHAEGNFTGVGTLRMREAPDETWPRPGGAVLYTGSRIAAAGHHAGPLASIGDDSDGQLYLAACRAAGVATDGIEIVAGTPTTRCLLIYNDDGTYGCLLRIGRTVLTDAQLALAAAADLVVFTAGDPGLQLRLLDGLPASVQVAWIAKHDPAAFPDAFVQKLLRRAAYVFCNQGERGWVDGLRQGAPAGQLLFETRGADGVSVEQGGAVAFLPATPVSTNDTTGAGDVFAGAALGALLHGSVPAVAAGAGMSAAAALLRGRAVPV